MKLSDIKQAVYQRFNVNDTPSLKKRTCIPFLYPKGIPSFSKRSTWESLYRKYIGVLPGEENEIGYGCINGLNIFKYTHPWTIFGLDPKSATTDDINNAYNRLCNQFTDPAIVDKLTILYKSITEDFDLNRADLENLGKKYFEKWG